MAKGKKQRKNEDSEDESFEMIPSDQEEVPEPTKAAGKKGKKDRKKKKEADLEDAQKELESIAAGDDVDLADEIDEKPSKKDKKSKKTKIVVESDDEEEEEDKPKEKATKSKKKKAKDNSDDEMESKTPAKSQKSGFSALLMGDSDEDPLVDSDEAPMITKAPEPEKKKDKKKKKKKAATEKKDEDELDELDKALAELNIEKVPEEDEKAKKRREKKERQKQKAKEDETKEDQQPAAASKEPTPEVEKDKDQPEGDDDDTAEGQGNKKKKGKKGQQEDDKKAKKKGGLGKVAKQLQEALRIQEELREKARIEEEERIRKEEEAEREREEKLRIETEKKELKKQRERERKEQLRKEGKLLTKKQQQEKARAEQMLAAMRAQGMDIPEGGVKRGPRPGTRIRKPKSKSQTPEVEDNKENKNEDEESQQDIKTDEVITDDPQEAVPEEKKVEEVEEVLDSWDAVLEEDDKKKETEKPSAEDKKEGEEEAEDEDEDDDDEDESSSDEEDSDESEDESSEEETEDRRERALNRIAKRKAEAEAKRTTDNLRAPVVVVMGHVDTGKTKILDKLRRTNVQDGEAGGITQQIGATNVPIEVIHEQCKMVNDYSKETTKLPGLLIIDTPGHESFSNLRDRGSSLCDIAILVVDIMHSLEPQTIESINLLKKKKVPFVIALNKIDVLYGWKPNRHKDIKDVIENQAINTKHQFEKLSKQVVVGMAEQGLNVALFWENPDPTDYISMIPTSAHSGDGMGNLMGQLVNLSQDMLAKRLAFSEELQATVLEVKAIPGLGTTIDIVLLNGRLREGQTMIVAGTEGPIVTQIRGLLTPAKMQDLRVKNNYVQHKEISGAQGVKIAAKELEKTVAGLNLLIANQSDEVDICKEDMEKRLESALKSFKLKDRGVFVQASTLGSLEALLEFLKGEKIPYAGVKIGPVVRKDVMKASVMLEHEPKYTIILAFDVRIERDAQDLADKEGVKIFQADIIYHLFDRFTEYQEELKRQKREEFKHVAVFPCKLKVLPNLVFAKRQPIVCGVKVEAGVVKPGTPICVPSKEFCNIGILTSIQNNNKEVDVARKGDEVCVKIDPVPGEAPKMFGRHFDEKDFLVSKISRASIDACKDYFREDLQKADWALMVELKKLFEIM